MYIANGSAFCDKENNIYGVKADGYIFALISAKTAIIAKAEAIRIYSNYLALIEPEKIEAEIISNSVFQAYRERLYHE